MIERGTQQKGGASIVVDRPVFFVGQGRSGTTLLFEAFSRRRDVGGILNVSDRWPRWPQIGVLFALAHNRSVSVLGRKPQHDRLSTFNKIRPKHAEGYHWWDVVAGEDLHFGYSFLRNCVAEPARAERIRAEVARLLSWQQKKRFATKITGPTRMVFLDSVFPDARFVHVIRDGRAVTQSLMRQDWWLERATSPRWEGGVDEKEIEAWRKAGGDPAVLTALQWRRVIEVAWEERSKLGLAEDRYLEIKYESFVSDPVGTLRRIFEFAGLGTSREAEAEVESRPPSREMNEKFYRDFDETAQARIIAALGEPMRTLGYST